MSDIWTFARNREEEAKKAEGRKRGNLPGKGKSGGMAFQGSGVDPYIGWNFHPTNNTRYISIRGGMSECDLPIYGTAYLCTCL
jgi:hypothetical protein